MFPAKQLSRYPQPKKFSLKTFRGWQKYFPNEEWIE